jgi:predicted RNA binding protein YcfA (HicA-like mRNA interferase family)
VVIARVKNYSSRQIISMLIKNGWYIVAQEGSHVHLKHTSIPGKVTIPPPRKDLTKKTLHSIAKFSGLALG